jgi:putative ABC transport system ATP-binding protein
MTVIKVENLTKIYQAGQVQIKALNNVSFAINSGEFVAIMGPSGSGKSTLMHILGALDIPTSGNYWLDNKLISKLNEDQLAEIRNTKIGFVFQAYNLLPRTSALKNIVVPMIYGGYPKKKREQKAKKLLEQVGLGNRLDHTPAQLSGGQQQRVAIARSLAMDPQLLLADEPTGNIASKQAKEIMAVFQEVNSHGHTVVMITHEPEITKYAKRVIHIKDGLIIKDSLIKQRIIKN